MNKKFNIIDDLYNNLLIYISGHSSKTVAVLYVIGKHSLSNGKVGYRICPLNRTDDSFDASEDELINCIKENDLILWSVGNITKFNNLSLVFPCKNDKGVEYLKSASDDSIKNNLENLPDIN